MFAYIDYLVHALVVVLTFYFLLGQVLCFCAGGPACLRGLIVLSLSFCVLAYLLLGFST